MARGLCFAHLLAHLLVHTVACVDRVLPIGSGEAGYAKICFGILHTRVHDEIGALETGTIHTSGNKRLSRVITARYVLVWIKKT